MRMMTLVLAMMVLLPGVATALTEDGNYMTVGSIGCGTYISQYETSLRSRPAPGMVHNDFGQTFGWIWGYITAYNSWVSNGKNDIRSGADSDSILLWIANYCRENPLKNTADAMESLMLELEGR